MTFQDAQAQLAGLVQKITPGLAPDALDEISSDMLNLQLGMPNTPEFDPIRQTIADFLPRLVGQAAQAVLAELQSRTAASAPRPRCSRTPPTRPQPTRACSRLKNQN